MSSKTPADVSSHKRKSELLLIPETILKKRHDLDDLARKRAATLAEKNDAASSGGGTAKRGFYVKKPERFLARATSRRNHSTRLQRVNKKGMQKRASNEKTFAIKTVGAVAADIVTTTDTSSHNEEQQEGMSVKYQTNSVGAPMVFAIRIKEDFGLPKVVQHVLKQRLQLSTIHHGVFLRYDAKTRKNLHLVEPYVVYGPPSRAVVADLIERRGHGQAGHERVPLSDNMVIEEALGKHNIICKEDLVHELCSIGKSFQAAAQFLNPFVLSDSKTDFERRTLKIKDGKEYGDRGEAINEYIKQVL